MQSLAEKLPHISKNDLFNIAVAYNKVEDVLYLLKTYREEINVFNLDNGNFLLDSITNVRLLIDILVNGKGKFTHQNQRYSYTALARRFPAIMPYLIARMKNGVDPITKEKDVVTSFVDIALERNSPIAMKALLEFKEQMTDYRYTLLLCGCGSVDDLTERLDIVKEMGDECVETAYLCKNFPVLHHLLKEVELMNPFLQQTIASDGFYNDFVLRLPK
jgi:hypothetical protein